MADHVLSAPLAGPWLEAIAGGRSPGTYPVAQGLVFAALGLSEEAAFAVHQYGLATMMLSAALRLMKLNYLDAQRILFEVNAAAPAAYQRVAASRLDDMSSFAP